MSLLIPVWLIKTTGSLPPFIVSSLNYSGFSFFFNIWKCFPIPSSELTMSGSDGKVSTCNAGDRSSMPGSGRSPGGGHGNLLQCSGLKNPVDRGAWRATVHGLAKSQTRLSNQHCRFAHVTAALTSSPCERSLPPRVPD